MNPIASAVRISSSVLASQTRLWRGTVAFRPARRQPEQALVLYDYESCPYCRLVREALTEMDLDADIRPCPRGGKRFRPRAIERGGKRQFPLLEDPNTGTQLYESADIIAYLANTYDARVRRGNAVTRALAVAGGETASLMRGLRGMRARPSIAPAQPLELYSFESSPFSRLVRERLCELEIPYRLRNAGKARWEDMGPPGLRRALFPDLPVSGRNREQLLARAGKVQFPYLIDPNTGTELFESAAICDHLERHYAA